MGVVDGYAAFNFASQGWKGMIAGNKFCGEFRKTSEEALLDAKKLYEKIG